MYEGQFVGASRRSGCWQVLAHPQGVYNMHMAQLCSVSDVSGPECLLPSDQRTLLPAVAAAAAAAAALLLLLLCRCLARMRRSTTTCTHTDTQQGQPLGWLHRPARSLPATARLEDART